MLRNYDTEQNYCKINNFIKLELFQKIMKTTISKIKSMKGKEKIAMLTAYDYFTGKTVDEAGIDIILVGDSLGMVVLGYENTLSVTMSDMLRHTGAVARGAKNALIVGDMPANSYNDNKASLSNAKEFLKICGLL